MALVIRRREHAKDEAYDVFSGSERVGGIYCQLSHSQLDTIWRWTLNPNFDSGHMVRSLDRAKLAIRLAWDAWLKRADLIEATPPNGQLPEEEAAAEEIDLILKEFDGDPRRAIGALLHDLGVLAIDAQAVVSKGYVRGLDFSSALARHRARSG